MTTGEPVTMRGGWGQPIFRRGEQLEAYVLPVNLFEWLPLGYIATQALTSDGVQWTDAVTVAAGGAETKVFSSIVAPPKGGNLVAIQIALIAQMQSGGTTQAKTWQWRARNVGGTIWANLHAIVSENLTGAYVEKTRSGVFYNVAGFNQVPFEIALFVTPSAGENIIVQVKNSCIGQVLYKPL